MNLEHSAGVTAGPRYAYPQDVTSGTAMPPHNAVGSARYWRAALALFLAGFATFSLLYCPQPLLPTLSRAFGVGAAISSLSISLSTGLLAPSLVVAASLSDLWGRKSVMAGALLAASAFNAAAALAPSWPLFLVLRALEGVALGGVPAVAMTYLAEETEPQGLGLAMGIYVGSTAVGGMSGRVITGFASSLLSRRAAIGIIAALGLVAALGFAVLLPTARHFHPRSLGLGSQARAFATAFRNPALRVLYAFAFVSMGGFVAIYNYAGFRLEAAPYSLDAAQQGLVFTLYLLGTAGSALAGAMANRFGKGPVISAACLVFLGGVGATLFMPLGMVILGIALITFGFFAGHAVASGSIGGLAGQVKGQAASLYMLSYYAGSSLLGTGGGWFWSTGGWVWVAAFVAALQGAALIIGLRIAASRGLDVAHK